MADTRQRIAGHLPIDTISIDEIVARHRDEWILMRVTKHDEDGWPERGILLDRAATQEEILKAVERHAPKLEEEGGPFYTFFAEPLITSGPEYAAAVAEFFAGLIRATGEHDVRAGR